MRNHTSHCMSTTRPAAERESKARCRQPVRLGRTYGYAFLHPYVWHVTTAHTYVSSASITRTHPYVQAIRTARTEKALSCNAFSSYGPYVRVVCTELPYVRAVKTRVLTLSSVIKFTYLLNNH